VRSVALLLIAVVAATLPVCFAVPWIGVLVWSWIGYMQPHRLVGDVAFDMHFGAVVGSVTLLGAAFAFARRGQRWALPRAPEVGLLAALWVTFFLSTCFAVFDADLAWMHLDRVSRTLVLVFLTMLLFQNRDRLHWLLIVIVVSLGFHGVTRGTWALWTGGVTPVEGPLQSYMQDNNWFGHVMTMVLPLIVLVQKRHGSRWIRLAAGAAFCLTVVAILGTYSRGSFLGLLVVLGVLVAKAERTRRAFARLVAGAAVVALLAPTPWFDRMRTLGDIPADTSAGMRVNQSYVALRLILDHPVLGTGFRPFREEAFARYLPGYELHRDSHNHWLQVAAEHGLIGLALFLSLLVSLMFSLRRLIRATRDHREWRWAHDYGQMIEASMIAYLVGGFFVNDPYSFLFYHLVVMVVVLRQIVPVERLALATRPAATA
jgi:probable O-glycosylation ligase (exosortase A-associated)